MEKIDKVKSPSCPGKVGDRKHRFELDKKDNQNKRQTLDEEPIDIFLNLSVGSKLGINESGQRFDLTV